LKSKLGLAPIGFAALFFLLRLPAFPQEYLDYDDPAIRDLLRQGIEASFREDYAPAEACFDSLVRLGPDDPAGYFFRSALYHAQMIDYESDFRAKEFDENVKMAKKLARKRIKKNKNDAWTYLVLGNSYGAKAVYDAKRGKWFSGLEEGLMAKSALKEALKRDPEMYDAYVGLGSYHYWASVVTKAFHWLPFIGDDRERGMAEMQLALDKSLFSSTAAASGLVWMYIHEGDFDRAIDLAQRMQSKYPQGKSFLWPLAEAYYDKLDWNNALASYQELLGRLQEEHDQEKIDQSYNLVECRFFIAHCLFGLGRYDQCDSVCQEILNFSLDNAVQKRQKDKLKKIQALSEKCRNLTRSQEGP
jgi:tetratricopeptide (TPR) repeat protein